MKKRSIRWMILFTIITCGIYGFFWYYSFQDQLKSETGLGYKGSTHLLFSFLTIGIYWFYWQYAAGKRLEKIGTPDNSVLYLILALVACGWLNPFLMQHQVNQIA